MNEAASQARELCCDRVIRNIDEIETVVQIHEWMDPTVGQVIFFMCILETHTEDIQQIRREPWGNLSTISCSHDLCSVKRRKNS
jgi:hypothetical protein